MKKLFKNLRKSYIIRSFIFIVIWVILECLYVEELAKITTNLVYDFTSVNLIKTVIGFFIFILIWEFTEFIGDYWDAILNTEIENETNHYWYNIAYKTKPSILKKANTGYISGLIENLVFRRGVTISNAMLSLMLGVLYIIYFTIRMSTIHIFYGIALIVLSIVGAIIRVVGNIATKPYYSKLSEVQGERTKLFIDVVTNISTVQKMQADNFMQEKMNEVKKQCFEYTKKACYLDELFFCCYKVTIYMYAPICLFIMTKIGTNGYDSVEFLSLLSMVSIQLVHQAKGIANFLKNFTLHNVAYNKVDEILNIENQRNLSLINNFQKAEIKDLSYSYDYDEENKITVNIPYFIVNKNDRICIYGESGQGKTTTLNILSGEIESNNLYIDNKQYNGRLDCVFISQDTEIFDMSLRDNLTLGNKELKDEELIFLMREVGLGEWYDKQKNGLDTILGERGVFVSTGQRQRLNLIRGLLIKNKEIYLLDEPTSNVDDETEQKIIKLLDKMLINKTVIIVSHKPAIKEICNKEWIFENSTIRKVK